MSEENALKNLHVGLETTYEVHKDQVNSERDVLVAVLHWRLIARGFRCVGTGPNFSPESDLRPSELLPPDWNKDDNQVDLRYVNEIGSGNRKYILAVTKADKLLVFNVCRVADEKVATLTLSPEKEVNPEYTAKNFRSTFAGVDDLVKKIDTDVIDVLFPPKKESPKKSVKEESPKRRHDDDRSPGTGPPPRLPDMPNNPMQPRYDPPGPGFGPPDWDGGRSDLDPLGRRAPGGGSLMEPPGRRGMPGGPRFDPFRPNNPEMFPGMGGVGGMIGMGGRGGRGNRFGDEMPPPGFNDHMFM